MPEPTPHTPFAQVPDDWWIAIRCRCKTVEYHAAHRLRLDPRMTAAELLSRLRCQGCGERPHEAAWERWRDGLSRIQGGTCRVAILPESDLAAGQAPSP